MNWKGPKASTRAPPTTCKIYAQFLSPCSVTPGAGRQGSAPQDRRRRRPKQSAFRATICASPCQHWRLPRSLPKQCQMSADANVRNGSESKMTEGQSCHNESSDFSVLQLAVHETYLNSFLERRLFHMSVRQTRDRPPRRPCSVSPRQRSRSGGSGRTPDFTQSG